MRVSDIDQYVLLREKFLNEKAELEARLEKINAALAGGSTGRKRGRKGGRKAAAAKPAATKRKGRRRARNAMPLKEAVLQVTAKGPLDKKTILAGLEKVGYKFTAKNPMNSLNTMLYSDKVFKNFGGKFGPAK